MPDYRLMLEGFGFSRVTKRGEEITADCLFCGGRRKFYFNTSKLVAICFRGCFAGSAVTLISRLDGCEPEAARARLEEGVDWFTKFNAMVNRKEVINIRRTPLHVPVFRKLNRNEMDYLIRRHVDLSLAESHGAMGCDNVESLVSSFRDCDMSESVRLLEAFPRRFLYLMNRIIWPILTIDGNLHSYEARTIVNQEPKVCFPVGINVKETVFISKRQEKDWIILVEGMLDALTVEAWNFPVASMFSNGVSKEQSAYLHKFSRIYLCFDSDAGGELGFLSAVERLFEGTALFEMILPEGKDPNDCNMAEFTKAFVEAKQITEGHRLVKMKRKKTSRR